MFINHTCVGSLFERKCHFLTVKDLNEGNLFSEELKQMYNNIEN